MIYPLCCCIDSIYSCQLVIKGVHCTQWLFSFPMPALCRDSQFSNRAQTSLAHVRDTTFFLPSFPASIHKAPSFTSPA